MKSDQWYVYQFLPKTLYLPASNVKMNMQKNVLNSTYLDRNRRLNLVLLGFLLASCMFFTVYDWVWENIWWTTVSIYLPCFLMFGIGFRAWQRFSPKQLFLFCGMLGLIDLFLVGYGGYLWVQGEMLWGPLTIGFAGLTILLTWQAFAAQRELRQREKLS